MTLEQKASESAYLQRNFPSKNLALQGNLNSFFVKKNTDPLSFVKLDWFGKLLHLISYNKDALYEYGLFIKPLIEKIESEMFSIMSLIKTYETNNPKVRLDISRLDNVYRSFFNVKLDLILSYRSLSRATILSTVDKLYDDASAFQQLGEEIYRGIHHGLYYN